MRGIPRAAAGAVVLAAMASGAVPSGASAQLPGVDALVSASVKTHTGTLTSPRLRTKNRDALVLAFVVAGGTSRGERVTRIYGDGLRWSLVAHSDGGNGATEVWRARAKHWLSGRIVAKLASAAYPASITIVAYGGSSPYLSAHAASKGHASTPRVKLKPTAGSLVWVVGLSERQRRPALVSNVSACGRVVLRTFDRRHRTGAWIELTAARSSHVASAAGASWSRDWHLASVDIVVPGLKRLIEEGLLCAHPANRPAASTAGATLPPNCPPMPAFEVGVEDDPVFLGLQPAMSPTHGFELATRVFHARVLRLSVSWGEVKRYGWAPYDRAVQMAREHCWAVHMTIMPTPTYAEGYLPSELSAKHLNSTLLASFAKEIATRYAGQVGRFAIMNEPNGPKFIPHTGSGTKNIPTYDQLYMAGYNAVKAADPSAEVIAGELGNESFPDWLDNVTALPSNGVGVHAYELNGEIREIVKTVAPKPVLITEDGVEASKSNQLALDFADEELARQEGAKEFIFYQLSRADSNERFYWNTGIE